jgi:hypothetical protein
MIAIVYVGEERFKKTGLANHRRFLNVIEKKYPCKTYFLTKDLIGRESFPDFYEGGNIQVWDFAQAVNRVSEKIIIRIRTDVWVNEAAVDAIIKELENVVNGVQDVSFLGPRLKTDYWHEYHRYPIAGVGDTVQDFIIIVNKEKILDFQSLLEVANRGQCKSGNKIFGNIVKPETKAYHALCPIYLIRTHYKRPTDAIVGLDFYIWYGKKSKVAIDWFCKKYNLPIPERFSKYYDENGVLKL